MKPVLIFGIGNESRGDDALGPLLLRAIESEIDPEQVELVETYQLQVENALELTGRSRVIFVDAAANLSAPYEFRKVEASLDRTPFSHALSPEALLAVHQRIAGPPPPAWILAIRGEHFELGSDLSEPARASLESAHCFLSGMLRSRLGISLVPG
ncbi:MAG: hydrogenase maturation protease [Burkholderiales bacterium]|nr:hydrogenase maturation protease [Burkholderiales bacterium]